MTANRSDREPKFDFFEIVKVISVGQLATPLEGYVLGRSQNSLGEWGYGVFLYDKGEVWVYRESELESTDRFDDEERKLYSQRPHIRVKVDPKTGEGNVEE